MLMKNGFDPEIASKFIKYIDVYSNSKVEIFFDIDDVFFNQMIKELE